MNITFRPATANDARAIRSLIQTVGINPMNLDWPRFMIAVNDSGEMLGCGQIKPHGDETHELASIAVWPRFQGQGVGRTIVEHLLASAQPPLYLTCRAELRPFYEHFGFYTLDDKQMPPYFRRLRGIARIVTRLIPRMGSMQIMRRD